MGSGDRKIRRTAHTPTDCNTIGPHDGSGYLVPLGLVTIASLEQRLAHVEVCPFSDPVRVGVVTRNMYVSDMVTPGEVVERLHKCWAIICDDFTKRAPSAKDIFEDPVA